MLDIIRSDSRGAANHGWLDTKHTFSFADYHDPARMGFASLRVINEDRIEAGKGFGTHPHRDMEIITYLIDGALEHKDSMGNGSIIRPGDVQRMTAGTGVLHSEFNPSPEQPAHLLQIWILPEVNGLEPGYEQQFVSREDKLNRWALLGSRDGRDESVTIHQDVSLMATVLESGRELDYAFAAERKGFVQIVSGKVGLSAAGQEHSLQAGDGLRLGDAEVLRIRARDDAELLLFDLG